MTEEELNKMESLANYGATVYALQPDEMRSLVRLARVGLAALKNEPAQRRLIGNNWDSFSALPKPGGDT